MALADYMYRKTLTVLAAKVDANLSDYSVYVDLSDLGSDFHTGVRSDGGDIRITTSDGDTLVAREVVAIDTGAETGEVHFLAGSLSSSSNTIFYIYYGNATATEPTADSTYGSEAVWAKYGLSTRLQNLNDSTANANTGSAIGNAAPTASGKIGGAYAFDGTLDRIDVPHATSIDIGDFSFTASTIFKATNLAGSSQQNILNKYQSPFTRSILILGIRETSSGFEPNHIRWNYYDGTNDRNMYSTTAVNDSAWHIVHCVRSVNNFYLYLDGVQEDSDAIAMLTTDNTSDISIGGWINDAAGSLIGSQDDTRIIHKDVLSADQISTESNNLLDAGTFYSIGSQEVLIILDYLPTLTKAPAEPLGTWRIDNIAAGIRTTFGLKELRAGVNAKLPNNVFNENDHPDADGSIYGSPIPIYTGPVRGMLAYKIDTTTDTFKFADNGTASVQSMVDGDGASVTVTSTDLANSEFIWTGHTDETLYVSATAVNPNPIDSMKFFYTDTDYGASVPLAKLDTASTGKGYGATGARLDFVYGTSVGGTVEHNTVNIGLYVDKITKLGDIIKLIKNAAMLTAYTDTTGLFQVKSFSPQRSEGLLEITKDHVIHGSRVVPQINTSDAVTKCRVFFNKDHRTGAEQVYEFESDELRQRRGLDAHAVRDLHLPIADLRGATIRAQREVAFEGEPRWTLPLKVTQEFSQLEPSDYVKLNYQPTNGLGIRTVCEVVSKTYSGGIVVDLILRDIRGLRDRVGWYTSASPAFPASMGGAAITTWDSTWTDEEKRWVRANLAFWHDTDGYCETLSATDDAFWAHYATVYI